MAVWRNSNQTFYSVNSSNSTVQTVCPSPHRRVSGSVILAVGKNPRDAGIKTTLPRQRQLNRPRLFSRR